MPSREEVAAALKRFSTVTVKAVAQCPKCKEVVEADWTLCPDCGTRLPKFCAECGTQVIEKESACSQVRHEDRGPRFAGPMVETLKKTAELDAAGDALRPLRQAWGRTAQGGPAG